MPSATEAPAREPMRNPFYWTHERMERRYGAVFTSLVPTPEDWAAMTPERWAELTAQDEVREGTRCRTCRDDGVLQVNPSEVAPTRLARALMNDTRSLAWCQDCPPEVQAVRQLSGGMLASEWREFTFGAFVPKSPGDRNALAMVMAWASGQDERPILMLTGPYGVGKTHLAVAAAHRLVETGHSVSYYTSRAFLDAMRDSFDDPATPTGKVRMTLASPGVVAVLDDYGAEHETAWAAKELEGILAARYAGRMRTLITSNLSIEQIAQRPAADLGRLASRLSDRAEVAYVRVQGEDFRRTRRREAGEVVSR